MTYYAVSVALVNETEGHRFSDFEEELHRFDLKEDGTPDMGEIYRQAQREYGRCVSSVYVDREDGSPRRVGWYFVKRCQYEDTGEPYLRGAWVRVLAIEPAQRSYVEVK